MGKELIFIFISLLLSAFFSAVEIAFISANRLHIRIQASQSIANRILLFFSEKKNLFISTILLGNTITLVIYGIFMTNILEPYIREFIMMIFHTTETITENVFTLLLQTLLSTIIVLAVAEFLPKSLALNNSYRLLKISAIPMRIVYVIFYPATYVIMATYKLFFNKILGIKHEEEKKGFDLMELRHYILENNLQLPQEEEKTITDVNRKILSNALVFKSIKIRECMIPRKEIIAADIKIDIEKLIQISIKSGHSKIPIYEKSIDNIIGYCHIRDLFSKPKDIRTILNDIIIASETTLASKLMVHFIDKHKSIALVVDEFGGTSGIVTIEDIVEEIFGEIDDEYDENQLIINQLDENHYRLSARFEIDILNDQYEFDIPKGDYETLGGYIITIIHNIPKSGEIIENDLFRFEIKKMANAKIDLVEVYIKKNMVN